MNKLGVWIWGHLPLKHRMRGRLIWLLSPKFVVGVSGVLRDEEGRILLLRHTYRGKTPWGLPGGGLKPGELLEQCIEREFMEETGLRVEAMSMLSGAAHPEYKLVDIIYSCRLLPGESLDAFRPNAEVSEAHYFHLHELPQSIPPGQSRLIRIALAQARDRDD
ncbi:MAG TPA: NUDIX domain-containing protein [Chloroflexia bacterium]|nr:NUDIX domain-containing protein [Chloroflexia bacterium]